MQQVIFLRLKQILRFLGKIGSEVPDDDYLCLGYLTSFNKNEISKLRVEDVDQAFLGGSQIILTCRKCNSNCGAFIDVHLQEALKVREQLIFFLIQPVRY